MIRIQYEAVLRSMAKDMIALRVFMDEDEIDFKRKIDATNLDRDKIAENIFTLKLELRKLKPKDRNVLKEHLAYNLKIQAKLKRQIKDMLQFLHRLENAHKNSILALQNQLKAVSTVQFTP